jgi:hypothetical protein
VAFASDKRRLQRQQRKFWRWSITPTRRSARPLFSACCAQRSLGPKMDLPFLAVDGESRHVEQGFESFEEFWRGLDQACVCGLLFVCFALIVENLSDGIDAGKREARREIWGPIARKN